MRSFFFLFNFFYFRFLPLFIFWSICPERVFLKRRKPNIFWDGFTPAFFLFLSYLLSLTAWFFYPILALNFLVIGPNKSFFSSLFMFWKIDKKDLNLKSAESLSQNLTFLLYLSGKVRRRTAFVVFRSLEILGLILFSIGGVEVSNDFQSHLNPDIFDFLFPDFGGRFFWGGLALFSFSSFFLYFLLGFENLKKWKIRIKKVKNLPSFWEKLLVSETLLHPYFFISPDLRVLLQKEKMVFDEKIFRFLNKALRSNLPRIPDEWIRESLKESKD